MKDKLTNERSQYIKPKPEQKHFFILLGDIEEKLIGTKEECIKFFQKLPSPLTFRMFECTTQYNIWREFGSKIVQYKEVKRK
jgi:hypothetical protein